ncbi:hypothetical protein FRC08_002905, partial [Ceratobasidium sp. 394]
MSRARKSLPSTAHRLPKHLQTLTPRTYSRHNQPARRHCRNGHGPRPFLPDFPNCPHRGGCMKRDGWDVADARAPGSWDQSGVPPRLAVMLGRCSIQSQHRPGELGHSTRR